MFNKKYQLIDLNDKVEYIDDLRSMVEDFGLVSISRVLKLEITKIGCFAKEELYRSNNKKYYDYCFTDKNGLNCNAKWCLKTMSGKPVHPHQIISEYLREFPGGIESKKIKRFHERYNNTLTGSKGETRNYLDFKARNYKYKSAIKNKGRYEEFEGFKIRLMRTKHENRFLDFFEPYSDFLDFKCQERSWKKYRKTQYK